VAKVKESDFENPVPAPDDEDEVTLAAIDESVRDAKTGRVFSIEEVRKLLPKWITASF
jgi:predicted transcriptional regulator